MTIMPTKTTELSATEFKATCLKVMEDVRKSRRPVIVSKRGKPLVKIVPVDGKPRVPLFGYMKGTLQIVGDIVGPDPENWESER
jgi:prevent-host-death family protein